MTIRRLLTLVLFFCIAEILSAQPSEKYYASADGKSGRELKTALHHIIKNPDVLSYARLWKAFERTDKGERGRVMDIYSNNGRKANYYFNFLTDRCGNYKKEGDCFNREHLVPRSWFKAAPPMNSDLFHVYPTDGYVNNKRGNLPFGEVGISSWTSTNGSQIGQNTFGKYNRTVFEPIDEYKGDIARILFYMATAYEDKLPHWDSPQIGGKAYPGFSDWSLQMLLKWHRDDPVSIKEVRRNEEVFGLQHNRNPYVDYPVLVEHVWGNKKNKAFKSKKLMSSHLRQEYSPFERIVQAISSFF